MHRESISNIIRHSRATTVEIRIRRDAGELVMRIADNGIGVGGANGSERAWSNGLRGMARRIDELGGTLAFPATAAGTSIEVRLPVGETALAAAR